MSILEKYKLNVLEKLYLIIIIILLFQITRNISTILYVTILFISYFLFFASFLLSRMKNRMDIYFKRSELVFLITLTLIPFISLLYLDISDYIKTLPRYLITYPFIIITIIYKDFSIYFLRKVLQVLCVFIALAALSIPYQILFGEVNFFAESSYREGITRYASLAGSLTALGTLGSFSLIILLFTENFLFDKKIKIILIIIILMGMLVSLQKAALVNILLCMLAYLLFYGKIGIHKRVSTMLILIVSIIIIYYIIKDFQLGQYIDSLLGYTFATGTVGVEQDFLSRVWERPLKVVEYNNIQIKDLITGIGLGSLGGIMGLNTPQSHNNYFDLLFSGGILHLLMFVTLIIRIPFITIKKKITGLKITMFDRTYSVLMVLFLINMFIGAGSIYQPLTALFIFFTAFSYDKVVALVKEE